MRIRKLILKIVLWTIGVLVVLAGAGWLLFVPSAVEPDYQFVATWGAKGSAGGQFHDPTGIAIAGQDVFVADSRNGRIQVFDRTGKFKRQFGRAGKAKGELGRPMNLTVRNGELYVPEYFNDRIQVFGLDGKSRRIFGKPGKGPGEFSAPGGVAVAADGSLVVADFYGHRVQKLAPDGSFVSQWGETGKSGASAGKFGYPTDVAVSADGAVFVADGYNDRVQAFERDGSFSHKWGGPFAANIWGPFKGWFAVVTSIAVGPKGSVYVADFYNHRVQKFAPDGTFLTSFGRRGSGPGEFEFAMAVAVAGDGAVYVADFGNNRIQLWRPGAAR
jgi:DNA-binding beta-propeller fold protein YncE